MNEKDMNEIGIKQEQNEIQISKINNENITKEDY